MNYYVTRKAENAPVTIWRTFHQKTLAQAEAAKMRQLEPQHKWGIVHSVKMMRLIQEVSR